MGVDIDEEDGRGVYQAVQEEVRGEEGLDT
jgi:hypothetical protein